MTPEEMRDFKLKQCYTCKWLSYKSDTVGKEKENEFRILGRTCDFAVMNGRCRLCDPQDCKKRGFYVPRHSGRKRQKQKQRLNDFSAPPHRNSLEGREATVKGMLDEGMSIMEMAAILGVSTRMLRKFIEVRIYGQQREIDRLDGKTGGKDKK